MSDKKRVWVPDYPEAPAKISYYESIITKLESYYTDGTDNLANSDREELRSAAKNPNAEGPYYSTFITKKEKWFNDLRAFRNDLDYFMGVIDSRIQEAEKLKADWEHKKDLGHFEEY